MSTHRIILRVNLTKTQVLGNSETNPSYCDLFQGTHVLSQNVEKPCIYINTHILLLYMIFFHKFKVVESKYTSIVVNNFAMYTNLI
jgi:hypothetical protein